MNIEYFSISVIDKDWRLYDYLTGDIFAILTFDENDNLIESRAIDNNIIKITNYYEVDINDDVYKKILENINLIKNGQFHKNLKVDDNYHPIYKIINKDVYLVGILDNMYSYSSEESKLMAIKKMYRDRQIDSII